MKRRLVVVVMLGLAVLLRAEDQTWKLTDGSTVTVMKVLSQNATHVTVRSAAGIQQIDKRQLPDELKAQYPYDEAAAATKRAAEEAEKQRVAQAAERQAAAGKQRQVQSQAQPPAAQGGEGVAILSIRPAGPAIAFVTIANRTANMTEVDRDMFDGVNVNGAVYPSSRLTNPRGDILKRVRIPAGATTEVGVVFDIPEGDVPDIGAVHWRKR